MESAGQLFVLSGPSGVGKSTLRQLAKLRFPDLEYSISYTTRSPRPRERAGVDYHFVSFEAFRSMVKEGDFLEWAKVHNHYYGTSRSQVLEHVKRRKDVLLEIDVQGARKVKTYHPHACFIFVLPPDRKALKHRLQLRDTEGKKDLRIRLEQASREMLEASWYDYLIVNDRVEEAGEVLAAIILARRHRTESILPQVYHLIESLRPETVHLTRQQGQQPH